MVGVLLVTHGAIGTALLHEREPVLGGAPAQVATPLGLAAGRSGRPARCARASCSSRSTPATACWCSPTSSARRPATSSSRLLARRPRSRACPAYRCRCCCACSPTATARCAAAVKRALSGRRRRRGAHELGPVPGCLARTPTSSTSSACMRAPRRSSRTSPSGFQSEIWISRSGRRVNAKSIMGVMMLAAGQGHARCSSRPKAPTPTQALAALTELIAGQVRRRE